MRKFIVLSMISLDGVMQAPGGREEDVSDDFRFGGWVAPYDDNTYNMIVQEEMKPAEYLLGRKTFEIWEDYWPQHGDIWPGINSGTKYVLSSSRTSTDWDHTVFIDSMEGIQKLKRSAGPDIQVWGSSELVHLLLANDLVDELRLKIHPLLLGNGKKLFDNNVMPAAYTLTEHTLTSKGVMIAYYKRAGEVETGNIEDK